MPQVTDANGVTHVEPGYYGVIRASPNGPGPLPNFLVPAMVVDSYSGYPSNWISASDRFTDELTRLPFVLVTDSAGAKTAFGDGSDMVTAFNVAKRHGLPRAYCISAGKLVRWSIIVPATGPVSQFTLGGYYWGFPAGWTKIKFASSIFSYSVPEKISKITANVASGATRIYVDRTDWVVEGHRLELGDNDSANEAVVVLAIGRETNSDGTYKPFIDLTAATSAAYTTSAYAAIALYGTNVVASSAFSAGEGQKVIDWINANGGTALRAQRHANFTGVLPIAVSALTPMKDIGVWGTKALGTSPAGSASDIQDFLDDLDEQLFEDFVAAVGVQPREWFFGTSDGTAQANVSTWLRTQRALSEAAGAAATVGCAWGDTVISASDSTSPTYRARQSDNQDLRIVTPGADGLGSNLSLAPAVFGLRIGGGLRGNLTNKRLLGFSVYEKRWTRANREALCQGGVISYKLVSIGGAALPVVIQGLNTLQSNAATWNDNGTTPFIHQRSLADFVDFVLKTDCIDRVIGNEVNVDFVRGMVATRADALIEDGYIASFVVNSIERNAEGNGFDIDWLVTLPGVTDYVTAITTILTQ